MIPMYLEFDCPSNVIIKVNTKHGNLTNKLQLIYSLWLLKDNLSNYLLELSHTRDTGFVL